MSHSTSEHISPVSSHGPQNQPPSEIHETLSLLFRDGDAIIVSHLLANSNGMVKTPFASIDEAAAFAEALDQNPGVTNIYVNLQQLKPGSTRDRRPDVAQYTHFLVDIDRKNKKIDGVRVNASEEERDALRQAAITVAEWIGGIVKAYPLIADSGNGFHLCWSLKPVFRDPILPDEENQRTHKECLLAIKQRFDSEMVEIDPSLSEPEQIIRLWGTHNRRDPETPGRPHRQSRILETGRGQIFESQLGLLACEYRPPARTGSAPKRDVPALHEDFDEASWWEHYCEAFTQEGEHDGWQVTSICPATYEGAEAPGHRHTGSTLTGVRFDRGAPEFHCFSDDHCEVTFGQLVKHLNEYYPPFPGKIWDWGEEDFSEFADAVDEVEDDGLPEFAPAVDPGGIDESYNKKGTPCPACNKGLIIGARDAECPSCLEKSALAADLESTNPSIIKDDPLAFPEECLYGRLGELARALDVPLGLAYPAVVGCYSVLPETDRMCETRINLFVPLIAPVGGAKDVVIDRARRVLGIPPEDVSNCTVVSDRGLMNEIGDRPGEKRGDQRIPGPRKKLLVSKEMGDTLRKASIENSTLFGTFTNFWDENEKAVSDSKGRQEANCRLSWIGGIPIRANAPEEFAEAFGSQSAKGLLSRMILGYTDQKFRYKRGWKPPAVPEQISDPTVDFSSAVENFAKDIPAPCVSRITPEAEAMWDTWNCPQDEDGRLRYNLMKWALLTASGNREDTVGVECMGRAIIFMNWEARLRDVFKPGVAENSQAAKFAEVAIRTFARLNAAFKPVNWKTIANNYQWNERFGSQVVTWGIRSLIEAGKLVNVQAPKTGRHGSHVMLNDFTVEGVNRIKTAMGEVEPVRPKAAHGFRWSIDG
jgi:hypothetical protein